MTDIGRRWPNRLWPNRLFGQVSDRLWPTVGLTDFAQTDFGQFQCFKVF